MLEYYQTELRYVREAGAEWAERYPRIAGRLGINGTACEDPYVERLLEGLAFLSARVRLKMDAEFPVFTQSLLEAVFPTYLAPTPAMFIARFEPTLGDGSLASGVTIERGSILRGQISPGEQTPCTFTTAHDVTLWPIRTTSIAYRVLGADRAELTIDLETVGDIPFSELPLDDLTFFVRGAGDVPAKLLQLLCSRATDVRVGDEPPAPASAHLAHVGFEDDEAMLPVPIRAFGAYRLVQEYFALPERVNFVRLGGLRSGVSKTNAPRLRIRVEFDRPVSKFDEDLERIVNESSMRLWCTPVCNLFPKSSNRVEVDETRPEHHVVLDRTRMVDYEIHTIERVLGYDKSNKVVQEFHPLYNARGGNEGSGCYSIRREPRMRSAREQRVGARTSYAGSEIYISLTDPGTPPVHPDVCQLGVRVLATNRDLPITMPSGSDRTDFSLEASAPVGAVRIETGRKTPWNSFATDEMAWRTISHFSLNYLSLLERGDDGASGLRGMLELYTQEAATIRRQVDGIMGVEARDVVERARRAGPVTFARGLEIEIRYDATKFDGTTPFPLASVLDRFMARYVSINSFTRSRMVVPESGEVVTWPSRRGKLELI